MTLVANNELTLKYLGRVAANVILSISVAPIFCLQIVEESVDSAIETRTGRFNPPPEFNFDPPFTSAYIGETDEPIISRDVASNVAL